GMSDAERQRPAVAAAALTHEELDMAPEPATNDLARLGYWRHRTANSVGEEQARLRTVTWEEAQPWCNFVVLRPADLPPGLRVEILSLRPEAPPGRSDAVGQQGRPDWHEHNRCSLRFEVVGAARRLRVKQFLYDWAPPGFAPPCLWKSRNEPFAVGKNLGWLGTDYRQARGAAVSIARRSHSPGVRPRLSGLPGSLSSGLDSLSSGPDGL